MSLIEHKSLLLEDLQIALELELATIPPYMMALLSIPKGKNRAAADLIRSILMEEMLHLALVGNLISSLGGQSKLGKDNIPTYPLRMTFKGRSFSDRKFDVDLTGLSRAQLEIFLQLEMPSDLLAFLHPNLFAFEAMVPAPSIGDFYKDIEKKFRYLCEKFSPSEVFIGDSDKQIGPGYFWGALGNPIVVTNLETALKALELIVSQGEGSTLAGAAGEAAYFANPLNRGHYFRFKEIAEGRLFKSTDSPLGNPMGEKIETDFDACYTFFNNPTQATYVAGSHLEKLNSSFNRQYSIMLRQIELAFNGNPNLLYEAIVNGMHGLVGIALEMTEHVVPNSTAVGCPSFEWIEPIA